jgi:hypothetical protein
MVKRAWGEGGGRNNKDEVGGAIDRISSAKGPSPSQWNVIVGRRELNSTPRFGRLCFELGKKGGNVNGSLRNKLHAGDSRRAELSLRCLDADGRRTGRI